ncbi:hypothetical protein ColTof3_14434 [Colletotrichum tofieldiae]|nr:hypothetical protein ColTof3_14434 [Colletotrichum tofieldiae]
MNMGKEKAFDHEERPREVRRREKDAETANAEAVAAGARQAAVPNANALPLDPNQLLSVLGLLSGQPQGTPVPVPAAPSTGLPPNNNANVPTVTIFVTVTPPPVTQTVMIMVPTTVTTISPAAAATTTTSSTKDNIIALSSPTSSYEYAPPAAASPTSGCAASSISCERHNDSPGRIRSDASAAPNFSYCSLVFSISISLEHAEGRGRHSYCGGLTGCFRRCWSSIIPYKDGAYQCVEGNSDSRTAEKKNSTEARLVD